MQALFSYVLQQVQGNVLACAMWRRDQWVFQRDDDDNIIVALPNRVTFTMNQLDNDLKLKVGLA
jgi:hypothetical protein